MSCVRKKSPSPQPAQDLYISDWFKKARRYAESISDAWFILSAKYGLLNPTEIVGPYNKTLKTMPAKQRRDWTDEVSAKLIPFLRKDDELVILAGLDYRKYLVKELYSLGFKISIPLKGLRIGEQMHWLDGHLKGK